MCRLFVAISVAALAAFSTQASAQSSDTDAILKRLEAKVDALAKENAELRERVRKLEPGRQAAKTKPSRTSPPPQAAIAAPQEIVPPTLLNVSAVPALPEAKHTSGIVGGGEGMLIKPYYTGDGAPNVDAMASDPFFGFINYPQMPYDYQPGYRAWLGFVDASGWGARLRYFDYHQAASNPGVSDVTLFELGVPGIQTGALTLQTYDLEATKQLLYGDWSLTAFAGVRWATVHQRSDLEAIGFPIDDLALSYNGIGPTAGFEGEVSLVPGGPWSVYYAGRGALLYGKQTDNTSDFIGLYTFGYRMQNAFASSWEFNVGPQWKTPVAGVGDAFFRVTADAQYWQGVGNFTPIGVGSGGLNHNDYSGGFGLWGFTAAMGIER